MGTLKIKPGWMIGLSTRLRGGILYKKQELDHAVREDGLDYRKWMTERFIDDPAEHEEGVKVRGKIRSLIASACVWTPFGVLICPDDQLGDLETKLAEAGTLRDAYNAKAEHSRVEFDLIRGRVADSAKDAAQAIQAEMVELLGMLKEATASGNVASIREVANKATNMGKLLEQDTAAKTAAERAVQAARKVARQIVSRVEKGAEALETVLAEANLQAIDTARFAFTGEEEPGAFLKDALSYDEPAEEARLREIFEEATDELFAPEEPEPDLEAFHAAAQERLGLVPLPEPEAEP